VVKGLRVESGVALLPVCRYFWRLADPPSFRDREKRPPAVHGLEVLGVLPLPGSSGATEPAVCGCQTASTIRSTASLARLVASTTASAEGASKRWKQISSSGTKIERR
jgi:hypothetical protein